MSARWRVFKRLSDLERDSHPPQDVVPYAEFERLSDRWVELFENTNRRIDRIVQEEDQ